MQTTEQLAIDGGPKVRTSPLPTGKGLSVFGEEERAAALEVIESRSLFRYYGPALLRRVEGFEQAARELEAQADRFLAEGLEIGYFDVHMGVISKPAYAHTSQRFGRPFLYPGLDTSLTFTSIKGLSERAAADKKPWLLGWLERLAPGTHLLVCHAATPGAEISSITGPDSIPFRWAEEYRKSDLETLTDPDVIATVDKLGIELVTAAAAFAP